MFRKYEVSVKGNLLYLFGKSRFDKYVICTNYNALDFKLGDKPTLFNQTEVNNLIYRYGDIFNITEVKEG